MHIKSIKKECILKVLKGVQNTIKKECILKVLKRSAEYRIKKECILNGSISIIKIEGRLNRAAAVRNPGGKVRVEGVYP